MKKVIIRIGGMGCIRCSKTIEEYLNKQDGIKAKVYLDKENATIMYDEEKVMLDDIKKYVLDCGYEYLGEE